MKVKKLALKLMFIGCLLNHLHSYAQQKVLPKFPLTGKLISDFVPKGYDTLITKEGDLNKDGKSDIVLILKNIAEQDEYDTSTVKYNRILIILFRRENQYVLAAQANNLALCKICGFELAEVDELSLKIKNGVLTVFQHGGSTQQWESTRKFRYQNGDFYLIGMADENSSSYMNATPCDEGPPGSSYLELNLITGERILNEIDDDCKTTHKRDKIKVKPLVKMSNVDLNSYGY